MKKLLRFVLLVVVILAVILGVAVWRIDGIVKTAVERVGPRVTGTEITLEEVNLRPFRGTGRIAGLSVANPEGFKNPFILTLGELTLDIDTRSLLTDTIRIREVVVTAPEVVYEARVRGGSNVKVIQDRIAGPPGEDPPPVTGPDAPGKRVVIDRLFITGGTAKVAATAVGGMGGTLHLADVELTGIGEQTPLGVADVVRIVVETVLRSAGGVLQQVPGVEELRDLTGTVGGAAVNVVGRGADAVTDAARGVTDAARGLLRRGEEAKDGDDADPDAAETKVEEAARQAEDTVREGADRANRAVERGVRSLRSRLGGDPAAEDETDDGNDK